MASPQVNAIPDAVLVRLKEASIRGFIWAFIGLFYGTLFQFFVVFSKEAQPGLDPVMIACIMAATIGALLYGSMRLAVLITAMIAPVSMFYIISSGVSADPLELILLAAPIGGVVGAVYGFFSRGSRVYRADVKILTGFCAGGLAFLAYLPLSHSESVLPQMLLVGILCSLSGILYVTLVRIFIRVFDHLLPPSADGAIVGAGVSAFVAMIFFILVGDVDPAIAGSYAQIVGQILENLPESVMGGMLGAGIVGLLSGVFLTNWQDL